MSQGHDTATDRLVDVIRTIKLGRQTGVLTANCGEGMTQEEGTITFANGQVTQAILGRRVGSEALNALTTWVNCRYMFLSSAAESLAKQSTNKPRSTSRPGLNTPISPGKSDTGPLAAENRGKGEAGGQNSPAPVPTAPYRTQSLASALDAITHMGLSRAHRRLLVLIDGQRSISELIRLMGCSQNEVHELLLALERSALIQIPIIPPY